MELTELKNRITAVFTGSQEDLDEVLNQPLYSKGQHRGNKGNEGQLHIKQDNIHQLNDYELKDDDLEGAIRRSFERK